MLRLGKGAMGALLVLLVGACSKSATQLVLVVDTDLAVPTDLDLVRFRVEGPSGGEIDVPYDVTSISDFPLTLGLRPKGELGPFTMTVTGRRGGVDIVQQQRRASMSSEETLQVRFFLTQSCLTQSGPDCEADMTCDEGECVDVDTTPEPFPSTPGADAGGRDAAEPGLDAAVDSSADSTVVVDSAEDAGLDAPSPCEPIDCDDSMPCTVDECTALGCTHTPDERCTACDDSSECSDTEMGEWAECIYADSCGSTGQRTREVTAFECVGNICQPQVSTETDMAGCDRPSTEGVVCSTQPYGDWGACLASFNLCDPMGTRERQVLIQTCSAGVCGNETLMDESEDCARDADGYACGSTCGGGSGCACSGGSCVTGTPTRRRFRGYATDNPGDSVTITCDDGSGRSCSAEISSCTVDCEPDSMATLECRSSEMLYVHAGGIIPLPLPNCESSMDGSSYVVTCPLGNGGVFGSGTSGVCSNSPPAD